MRRKNLGITERQSYKMEMAKKKTVRIGKYQKKVLNVRI